MIDEAIQATIKNAVRDAFNELVKPYLVSLNARRISATEAGKILGCTRQTVMNRVKQGVLRAYYDRPNSQPRFLLSEILELTNKNN